MPNILKTYKLWFFLFCLAIAQQFAYAQKSKGELIFLADKSYNAGEYNLAVINYQKALSIDSTHLSTMYKCALSHQNLRNYNEAAYWFRKLISKDEKLEFIDSYFYLALIEKNIQQYDRALHHLQKLSELSQTHFLSEHIKNQLALEIESANFALENHNKLNQVFLQHLGSPINSPYSDFNPIYISSSNTLFFSRYSPVFDNDSVETMFSQAYITEIVKANETSKGWENPISISSKINNNRYHNANVCFNRSKSKVYFSRCLSSENAIGNCAIYSADIVENNWSNIKKLGENINIPGFSTTQPYFVETDQYKVLYFSSNRDAGFGGYDIWYSIMQNNVFQPATNLGTTINTSGNEITPSYQLEKNELYFSSDKHPGFGGYDIFKSQGGLNDWTSPQNLKLPVNSALNDIYFSPIQFSNEAYFASNRPGSFHMKDAEYCCTDIYFVDLGNDSIPSPISAIPELPKPSDSIQTKIKELLPLSLYFHNDEPDPKTLNTRTTKNYKDLLGSYITMKQEYKTKYSEGLDSISSLFAAQEIENFFTDSVEGGFEKLEQFATLLKTEIAQNKRITIKIKGYASPLNTKAYNLNLSKRRISSLRNFLYEYENGYFIPFMEDSINTAARIIIYEDPLGDSEASNFVSNNPNDQRNSVYSKSAALERKIQIILYSSSDSEESPLFEFPEMNWGKSNFNIGTLTGNESYSSILYLKNTGKSELEIKNILLNSNILQIQFEKTTLLPDEEIKVFVLIKTNEIATTNYLEKIEFLTNMPEPKQVIYLKFDKK